VGELGGCCFEEEGINMLSEKEMKGRKGKGKKRFMGYHKRKKTNYMEGERKTV